MNAVAAKPVGEFLAIRLPLVLTLNQKEHASHCVIVKKLAGFGAFLVQRSTYKQHTLLYAACAQGTAQERGVGPVVGVDAFVEHAETQLHSSVQATICDAC
jgi:hypothetical protein